MIRNRFLHRLDPHAILSVTVPLFVYLLTLAPSVTFFDSGEFITAIASLGTAHSPGYPLFINYAKPFTFLPFGSIAFRVNIATAVSAAMACYAVYLLVSHLIRPPGSDSSAPVPWWGKTAALAAALTFAFSPRLWLQSNHDKPYPLVSFMAAMVFYLVLLWRERYREGTERPAYIYLGAFLCGLAFGAHQTIILMLPAYAFLILAMNWRLVARGKEMILAAAFGLLGFAVHLHMIVRATQNPLLNWGDPKTMGQFLWNLLRRGYPVEAPERDLVLLWHQLKAFNPANEFTWVGCGLLLIGIAGFWRTRKAEAAAYGMGVAFFLLVIAGYFNTPMDMIFLTEEFFTPLYLLSAVFIGMGLFHVLDTAVAGIKAENLRLLPVRGLMLVCLMVLPATVCALNYVENDQHENYIAFDYASNTLRSLPPRGVLLTWGDSGAFPLWYLQGVERMREDLDLLHTPHLVFKWYLDSFPHLFENSLLRRVPLESLSSDNALLLAIEEQIRNRPVFVDFSTRYSVALPGYRIQQEGIIYQLEVASMSAARPPRLSLWDTYSMRGINGEMFFRDLDTTKAILIYANCYLEAAETLLGMGRHAEGVYAARMAEKISPALHDQVKFLLAGYRRQ